MVISSDDSTNLIHSIQKPHLPGIQDLNETAVKSPSQDFWMICLLVQHKAHTIKSYSILTSMGFLPSGTHKGFGQGLLLGFLLGKALLSQKF